MNRFIVSTVASRRCFSSSSFVTARRTALLSSPARPNVWLSSVFRPSSSSPSPPPQQVSSNGLPTTRRFLSNNTSYNTQQQEALHKELSQVVGKKAANASATTTSSSSSSNSIPPSPPPPSQSFWQKYWPGVVTFSLLVLSGQSLNAGLLKREAEERADAFFALQELRLRSLEAVFSAETVLRLTERLHAALLEQEQTEQQRAAKESSSWGWFGGGQQRRDKSVNEEKIRTLLRQVIRDEIQEILQTMESLNAEQKELFAANLNKHLQQQQQPLDHSNNIKDTTKKEKNVVDLLLSSKEDRMLNEMSVEFSTDNDSDENEEAVVSAKHNSSDAAPPPKGFTM